MRIHTQVKLSGEEIKLDPPSGVFSIGSCFSTCIPRHLKRSKFNVCSNPCGITYNPISIGNQLHALNAQIPLSSSVLIQDEPYPLEHHGSFKMSSLEEQNRNILESWSPAQEQFNRGQMLLITLGTAFIFTLKDRVVNNCHRLPAKMFQERLLTVEETVVALQAPLEEWLSKDLGRRVVLTVSPVRHLRNGLQGNTLSKSILRIACDHLVQSSRILYFPAYEIMVDELRGYRFYKDDLLHPSDRAEQYIWECFQSWILSQRSAVLYKEVLRLERALGHRFQRKPDQPWIDALTKRMDHLERAHPDLDWTEEREHCEQRISDIN